MTTYNPPPQKPPLILANEDNTVTKCPGVYVCVCVCECMSSFIYAVV